MSDNSVEQELTETEYPCPKGCDETLAYGGFVDAREGIRGYSCSECNYIWTTGGLKRLGIIEDKSR